MAEYQIYNENNMETLARMADNSLDAIVTDAPYGLGKEPDPLSVLESWITTGYHEIIGKGFMGKEWDAFVPQPAFWKEVYRVLKPGGYVLCFFGTRTYDWGTLAIRLAGFEIRDCIQWIYGSGFPKSLNVTKAGGPNEWGGYGTALKPAYEPICVARKPLIGTVAENVLKHQCGAINLNECRIGDTGARNNGRNTDSNIYGKFGRMEKVDYNMGRFPANIILDEIAAAMLDEQSGLLTSGKMSAGTRRSNLAGYAGPMPNITGSETYGDAGGASRFFYCAKASRADRDYGCEGMEYKEVGLKSNTSDQHITRRDGFVPSPLRNNHPTVKPIALMRYLVRLVKTPFDTCTILDPFMGSGTTGIACMLEGINFYGCESEKDSYDIAAVRIEYAKQEYLKEGAKPKQGDLFI